MAKPTEKRTNIFKNIIWQHFAGESHQVVKITVLFINTSPACTWGEGVGLVHGQSRGKVQ
jgi:hypothetical protein